jgi:choline dehydrogenase-like flavoprotein
VTGFVQAQSGRPRQYTGDKIPPDGYKGRRSGCVEFAQYATGPVYTLNATNEVILSVSAVDTPQLLMLSSVREKAHLRKFKLKAIVNSPMVGKNLQDHVVLPNVWSVNATFTFVDVARNYSIAQAYLSQWIAKRTGPFATALNEEIGWLRLPQSVYLRYHTRSIIRSAFPSL